MTKRTLPTMLLAVAGCGTVPPPPTHGVHTTEVNAHALITMAETWELRRVEHAGVDVKTTVKLEAEIVFPAPGDYTVRFWGRNKSGPDILLVELRRDVSRMKSETVALGGYADRVEVVYALPGEEHRTAHQFRYVGTVWGR